MENKIKEISWEELEELNQQLAQEVSKEKFDALLCVGSGGLILGKLISDYNGIPLSVIIAESYNPGESNRHETLLSNVATIRPLKGKILLIDDLVDSGDTLTKIIDKLNQNKEITEIKTAVIYTKPWSKFKPDFFVNKSEDWLVFPYEKKEFKNGLKDYHRF